MHACRASTGTQITTLVKKQAYKELLLAYKMTSFEDRLHEYTVTERNVCTHPMHACALTHRHTCAKNYARTETHEPLPARATCCNKRLRVL
jgi:hypothetical protein